MDDCIFCKIIKGEIPSQKIYEDDEVFAFLDIAPINKGHALVIPKAHHEKLMDTPNEVAQDLIVKVKKVMKAVKQATNADGINVGVNNEKAAGQVVFHTHFHVIPRFNDDGLKMWPSGEYKEDEMKDYAEKIAKLL